MEKQVVAKQLEVGDWILNGCNVYQIANKIPLGDRITLTLTQKGQRFLASIQENEAIEVVDERDGWICE